MNKAGQKIYTSIEMHPKFADSGEAYMTGLGVTDIAKADFQFRDLRATAATAVDEESGTRSAQALLGHTTEGMTAHYIRHKVGKKVKPVR